MNCEICKQEIEIKKGVRHEIVDNFLSYLDEIEEADVYVPKVVRKFVKIRKDIEVNFDIGFQTYKLDDLTACEGCFERAKEVSQ